MSAVAFSRWVWLPMTHAEKQSVSSSLTVSIWEGGREGGREEGGRAGGRDGGKEGGKEGGREGEGSGITEEKTSHAPKVKDITLLAQTCHHRMQQHAFLTLLAWL